MPIPQARYLEDLDLTGKPMTKTELVASLAERIGSEKKHAAATLDAIGDIVATEIAKGGAVTLPGIGKIDRRERPERMVRNPATGEQIRKDADKQVKVSVAKGLKDRVQG